MIKVCVTGAAGKMGKTNIKVIVEDKECNLSGAVEKENSPYIGCDAGEIAGVGKLGVLIVDDLQKAIGECDVVIDFSSPDAFDKNIKVVMESKKAFVCGTTGLTDEQKNKIKEAGKVIPVIWAPNFSVGIAVLNKIVSLCCNVLGEDFDVEILELHHRMKKDSPSGTAVKLLNTVREIKKTENIIYGREGIIGERPRGQIGVFAIRGGDVTGEHTVYFLGQGERIELTHRASSRETFSRGAIRAAKYILEKGVGLYTIEDVLNLR